MVPPSMKGGGRLPFNTLRTKGKGKAVKGKGKGKKGKGKGKNKGKAAGVYKVAGKFCCTQMGNGSVLCAKYQKGECTAADCNEGAHKCAVHTGRGRVCAKAHPAKDCRLWSSPN